MNPLGLLFVSSLAAAAATVLFVTSFAQERPSLERAVARMRRAPSPVVGSRPGDVWTVTGRLALRVAGPSSAVLPAPSVLRLGGRTTEEHAAHLVAGAVGGFVGPIALVGTGHAVGVVPLGVQLSVGLGLLGAAVVPMMIHGRLVERARDARADLRHQLSAYLDVVTMLLAGNSGHEGALEQAAHAGDGRLFRELRRRMREAGATGRSLVEALDTTGLELGLVELRQVAATAALSSAEGAPVVRTFAATCATLRSTLASEQESEARLRTSRLTPPLVGMALIFMALVIYPALSLSR